MKQTICAWFGALTALITTAFGGWDGALTTLFIFMAIDYLSGWILAGVFHRSEKTETGTLSSAVGFRGLCKKGMELLVVLIAARLDLLMGSDFLRDAVCLGFLLNELLSIVENAGAMGVPIPGPLRRAIALLEEQQKEQ